MFITTTTAIVTGCLVYLERKLAEREKSLAASLATSKKVIVRKEPTRQLKRRTKGRQPTEKELSMQRLDRNIEISAVALGFSVLGAFVAAPLSYVSLAGMAWLCEDIVKTAYRRLKKGELSIEILDTIAYAGFLVMGYAFLGSLGVLTYYGSKKFLLKTEDEATNKLVNIFGEQPQSVWIVVNGVEVEIPFEDLQIGSIVSVHTGSMIPIDGKIVHGYAAVDQRALTGESQPVEKNVGDSCFASTLVIEGNIHIQVEKAGSETVTAQVGQILNNTIDFKDEMVSVGERLADKSVLPLLILGTLSIPIIGVVGSTAIFNASLGYSLRLVSPVLMLNFLTLASNRGVLIKDGRSLELLSEIDTVVFDKTGTLTLNQPHLSGIHTVNGISENELLTYAAAAEYKQSHPIALAIIQKAEDKGLPLLPIDDAKYEVGYGIKVSVDNKIVHIGSARFMEMEEIQTPVELKTLAEEGQRNGFTYVHVAIDRQAAGVLELQPTVRPEAKQVVQALHDHKMSCYIISGDHLLPTTYLAKQLGIENYFAEVLPEDKANLVEKLQKEGKKVCFIGDGINDSIALKKADVSVSLKGASTIATDTAQIIFMKENLEQLPFIFKLGRQFKKYMNNNIGTSVVPSIVSITGAFFFNFNVAGATIMNQLGLFSGMANSMYPKLNSNFLEEEIDLIEPTKEEPKKEVVVASTKDTEAIEETEKSNLTIRSLQKVSKKNVVKPKKILVSSNWLQRICSI